MPDKRIGSNGGRRFLPEVEVLKAIAIILVILSHLHIYAAYNKETLRLFNPYIAYFGVSIFFFLSGLTLYGSTGRIDTLKGVAAFYRRRALRIFPLYWVALVVFMLSFLFIPSFGIFFADAYYDFSATSFIVHMAGLQSFWGRYMGGMWFIGVILLYYLAYPIIVYFSKDTKELAGIGTVLLASFVLAYYPLNVLKDGHVALFLPVFLAGVIASKIDLFNDARYGRYMMLAAMTLAFSMLAHARLFPDNAFLFTGSPLSNIVMFGLYFIISVLLAVSFAVTACWCIKQLLPVPGSRTMKLCERVSYGSYAAYVFHMQVIGILTIMLGIFVKSTLYTDIIVLSLGLPVSIASGYVLQKCMDSLLRISSLDYRHVKVKPY